MPATRTTAAASSGKPAEFGRRQSDSTFECTGQPSAFQCLRSRSLIEHTPHVQEEEEEEAPVSTADRFQQLPSRRASTPVRTASVSASASASSSAQASRLRAPPALSPAQAATPARGSPLRMTVDAHLAPVADPHATEGASGPLGESMRPTAECSMSHHVPSAAASYNTAANPVNLGWSAPQSAGTLRLPTLPATWMALSSAAVQRTLGQPGVGAHHGAEQYGTPMAAWLPNRSASSSFPLQSSSTSMAPFSLSSDFQQVRNDRDEDRHLLMPSHLPVSTYFQVS